MVFINFFINSDEAAAPIVDNPKVANAFGGY